MKLVRFGEKGSERPGIWMNDGTILDVRGLAFHIEDFNEHFFAHEGLKQLTRLVEDPGAKFIEAEGMRLGPPIARPSKMVCVGANYADHAKEFGHDVPEEPILFSKVTSALNGPSDPIRLPDGARVVDGEAELAVVIGKEASKVHKDDALDFVAGYTVMNDVTERVVQKSNGQWIRGKGFDTFAPLGPFLVTADEVPDIESLEVWQKCNGLELQRASTADMMFKIPYLIEFISSGMTLYPGDVIATGTPSGIGSAREPQILLKKGDVVEVGVEGIGAQRSLVE